MGIGLEPGAAGGLLNFDAEDQAEMDAKKKTQDDALGSVLQRKFDQWFLARRQIEEEWLKDLRAFNQIGNPGDEALSLFHAHIYVGLTRMKCMSAYARIMDLLASDHWHIDATPVPEDRNGDRNAIDLYRQAMSERAELMQQEMEDQFVTLRYDELLSAAVLESCIVGTGAVKGIIPGVRKEEIWANMPGAGWDVMTSETPFPDARPVSIFDTYPDPYAVTPADVSGCFERHVMNRKDFADLKNNPQFDSARIDQILRDKTRGNHAPLYHETERRKISGLTDTTAAYAERFDVLEYWGQVSGHLLVREGVEGVEDEAEVYWCNVWTCDNQALLVKLMPMKKQRVPYNFFPYEKIPHQFWGVSPARMMRDSQATINSTVRALLDNMAIASGPQTEVSVPMLKAGEDPRSIKPWRVWLRDSGDPSEPAVRFYQPPSMVGELINVADQFRKYADEETSLPSYTHGDTVTPGLNKTASGMSMLMGAANITIKSVVKNLEEYLIKPLIQSLYDWNMQWSEREEIKGDLEVKVLLSSAVIAKEVQSQRIIQYLQLTNNQLDAMFVDRRYLLRQAAESLEIDPDKAVPEPEQQALDQSISMGMMYGQNPGASNIIPMQPPGMAPPGAGLGGSPGQPPSQPGNAFLGQVG